jgi:hypothetical protein
VRSMSKWVIAAILVASGCSSSSGDDTGGATGDVSSVDTGGNGTDGVDGTDGSSATDGTDGATEIDATDGSSTTDGTPPNCEVEPTIESLETNYFATSCALAGSCHKGPNPGGVLILDAGTAHANLVGVESMLAPGKQLVVPGDPDASFLVHKVEGTMAEGEGTIMPQGAPSPIDPECRIAALRAWIAAGAPQ